MYIALFILLKFLNIFFIFAQQCKVISNPNDLPNYLSYDICSKSHPCCAKTYQNTMLYNASHRFNDLLREIYLPLYKTLNLYESQILSILKRKLVNYNDFDPNSLDYISNETADTYDINNLRRRRFSVLLKHKLQYIYSSLDDQYLRSSVIAFNDGSAVWMSAFNETFNFLKLPNLYQNYQNNQNRLINANRSTETLQQLMFSEILQSYIPRSSKPLNTDKSADIIYPFQILDQTYVSCFRTHFKTLANEIDLSIADPSTSFFLRDPTNWLDNPFLSGPRLKTAVNHVSMLLWLLAGGRELFTPFVQSDRHGRLPITWPLSDPCMANLVRMYECQTCDSSSTTRRPICKTHCVDVNEACLSPQIERMAQAWGLYLRLIKQTLNKSKIKASPPTKTTTLTKSGVRSSRLSKLPNLIPTFSGVIDRFMKALKLFESKNVTSLLEGVQSEVTRICGNPTYKDVSSLLEHNITSKNSNNSKPLFKTSNAAMPENLDVAFDMTVREFLDELDDDNKWKKISLVTAKFNAIFSDIPNQMCSQDSQVGTSNKNCWNGEKIVPRYNKSAQNINPNYGMPLNLSHYRLHLLANSEINVLLFDRHIDNFRTLLENVQIRVSSPNLLAIRAKQKADQIEQDFGLLNVTSFNVFSAPAASSDPSGGQKKNILVLPEKSQFLIPNSMGQLIDSNNAPYGGSPVSSNDYKGNSKSDKYKPHQQQHSLNPTFIDLEMPNGPKNREYGSGLQSGGSILSSNNLGNLDPLAKTADIGNRKLSVVSDGNNNNVDDEDVGADREEYNSGSGRDPLKHASSDRTQPDAMPDDSQMTNSKNQPGHGESRKPSDIDNIDDNRISAAGTIVFTQTHLNSAMILIMALGYLRRHRYFF